MTAQFSDGIKYRAEQYSIAGMNGTGLFDPGVHGIQPVGRCTACWRGFVCDYAVEEGWLLLDELSICLNGRAPVLFGVPPKAPEGRVRLFDVVYEGLRHRLPYSGGLLLGAGFIDQLYVHMGFHPAWKYRNVHELVFRDGALVQETDRSAQMAGFRGYLGDRPLRPGTGAKREDIERWVEQCFNQKYRW